MGASSADDLHRPIHSVAAILEPAYDVAGDSIDYSVENGALQFGIFDGMGHGLDSAQTANLAIAAYRNARRQEHPLIDIATLIDATLERASGGDAYSTGVLARLDTDTGILTWVTLGHPSPMLFRNGRWITALELPPALPMGLWSALPADRRTETLPATGTEQLEPGDQVLLYTDGVVEAHAPGGELFGTVRLVDLVERGFSAGLATDESIRRIAMSVLAYQQAQLRDDATLLLVQWHPQTPG